MNSATRTDKGADWPLTLRLFVDLLTTIAAMVVTFIAIASATSIWQDVLHGRSTLASVGLNATLLAVFGSMSSRLGKRKTVGLSWRGVGLPISEVSATIFVALIVALGVAVMVALLLGTMGWLPATS